MTKRKRDVVGTLLRLSREAQITVMMVIVVTMLAPVLFGEPMTVAEGISLILSATVAGLCVRPAWTAVERAVFPVAIALPLHFTLTSILSWLAGLS